MASVILSGTPAIVDLGNLPPAVPQTLSLVGNTISLSGGGGAIDVATATSVSTSTQKLTAITYDTGLLETNVAGALNVGLGSAIGSTTIEGGKVVVSRGDLPPAVELVDTNTATIAKLSYNGNHIRSDKDIRIEGDLELKGVTPSVDFLNTIGTQKASLDYVELTDKVTLTGTNVVLESTGTGAPRVLCDATAGSLEVRGDAIPVRMRRYSATGTTLVSDIQLAGGGVVSIIGSTVAVEPTSGYLQITGTGIGAPPILRLFDGLDGGSIRFDTVNNGLNINAETGGIIMSLGGTAQVSMGGAGNIGVGGQGADGSVFLVKNDNTVYGALNYNGGNDTLNVDNGGSSISVGASGITLTTPSVLLGGITTYNSAAAATILGDVDNLDQVLTNNAYVPMTWYKRDTSFTIDPAQSLAFQTPDFVWRYSGGFATGGTNSESRYCGTLKYQIDVNISAEDLNDTVVWWVRLFNNNTSAPYYSTDFADERFGFVADRVVNPYSGVRNQCVSFSSTFDLDPGFTGQAVPVDGEIMRIEVYGWGITTTTTPRAQVSATIRPLRLLQ